VLHLDGWGDVWDGFGSGRRGEELRSVMKDSRLGSFGAVGLVLAFGLWTSLVSSIDGARVIAALVTAGACGRFASCAAAFSGKYPWEVGMAKGWVDGFTGYDLFTAGVCLLLFVPLAPFSWLLSASFAAAVGTFAAVSMNRRLGGVNGDVLGASEVAAELLALGVFSIL
jgi:adenosylcobinamide-GDP ribazoletransferase